MISVFGKLILGALLLAASAADLAWRRIPNRLICAGLTAFVLMAAASVFSRQNALLLGRLAAGATAFIIHLAPYLLGAMGAGDVKLALVLGLLSGWRDWLDFMAAYCLVLCVVSLLLFIRGKKRRPKNLPLAPLMTAAYFLCQICVI